MNDKGNQSEHLAKLVKEMITADPPETVKDRMDEILQRFRAELPGHPYVRRLEKKVKDAVSRPASAARRWLPVQVAAGVLALFLIVLGGVSLLRQRMVPVVWAEVADQVADIDRFMFQMKIRVPKGGRGGPPKRGPEPVGAEVAMTFYLSSEHGFRWDVHTEGQLVMSYYTTPGGDSVIVVDHAEESWMRFPTSPQRQAQSPLSPEEDPEEYIRRFLARGYRELGESTIDGVKVEGIEVTDPPAGVDSYLKGVGRLWVDVRSELPVRLELQGEAEGQNMEWIFDFRWGKQVDIEVFAPVIPPGFSPPPSESQETEQPGPVAGSNPAPPTNYTCDPHPNRRRAQTR